MDGRKVRGIIATILTAVVVTGGGIYLVWSLRPLILPVILGILLAYLFRPLKTAFKYRWLPNSVRVAFLFLVLTGGLLVGIRFLQNNIPNEKEKLEILVRMKYKFNEKFNHVMAIDPETGKGNAFYTLVAQDINPIRNSLNGYLELSPEQQEQFLEFYRGTAPVEAGMPALEPVPERYYKYFLANNQKTEMPILKTETVKTKAADKVPDESKSFVKLVMNILSIWFLLPIVFVFFLMDEGSINQFFVQLVPNRYFELALSVQQEVDEAIGKYLRGISMECGLVGISMALGLFLVGVQVKMALLIGILSGLATAIPFLGPVVGLGFGLTYALIAEDVHAAIPLVTADNFALAVVAVNITVMALDNLVFQPVVLGGAVNLHPLVVILGIMGASIMFGMAGVLLAIPTIVVLKVVTQHTFRGMKDYRII